MTTTISWPDIHAKYQGQDATRSDSSILRGELPQSKVRMARRRGIEIHREDLWANWELAVNGQAPFSINPLR